MLNKVKYLWWKWTAKVQSFFYNLTHFRQIKRDEIKIKKITKSFDGFLARELIGKTPVKITTAHKAGWSRAGDTRKAQEATLREDFVDLRLKEVQQIRILKELK